MLQLSDVRPEVNYIGIKFAALMRLLSKRLKFGQCCIFFCFLRVIVIILNRY